MSIDTNMEATQKSMSNMVKPGIMVFRLLCLAMTILLVAVGGKALAQYDNGSLLGTIHDSSGAVVPGSVVTITNNATGVVTTVAANSAGDYEVPSLHTGVYKISASASGFAIAVAENITISVGDASASICL